MMVMMVVGLVSCANEVSEVSMAAQQQENSVGRVGASTVTQNRSLEQSGRMKLEMTDVEEASVRAKKVIKSQGGFVEDMRQGDATSMEVRVPSKNLDQTMDELAKLGELKYRNVWVKDVTQESIDIAAELKSLQTLRGRLLGLYGKAKSVEEMLKIEKELARVQAKIDSLGASRKTMDRNVSYAQLSVVMDRKRVPGPLGAVAKGIGWIGGKLWVLN